IEADPSYNPVTNLELEYYHKDGSTFWLENKFSIIRDSSGKPVSILGEGRDISERKRVQDALRESEDKYRKLFEMESDALFLTDAQSGQILDANMAAVALYGYSLDELLGMRNVDLSAEPEKTKESSALASSSGVIAIPLRYHRKKDGTVFPVEINATSIVWNGRLAFIPVIRDITERRELEERIRQVRSDLLFAVSHDLKSPLQALHQTQEMLNELTPGEGLARFQEYSEIWRRNLQRLERMINNLMDSQRGEEGRFPLLLAPSNPVELIKRVVEDSQGFALSSQVSFDLKLQPVPEGVCDEEALARVVENLLTNAVKFSPKGGKVEVRLEMEGDALLLEVEDHGFGIPALEQAQLFQPFQRGRTAERKGIRGTGLGLYVCRRIVEEHGGSISLFSEEGKGTKVTVRLPWRIIGT
ncbi:MAG: ATP-binding protein, partial [bacterium]